jgi:hypothetical protein
VANGIFLSLERERLLGDRDLERLRPDFRREYKYLKQYFTKEMPEKKLFLPFFNIEPMSHNVMMNYSSFDATSRYIPRRIGIKNCRRLFNLIERTSSFNQLRGRMDSS